jgi:predicted DNA-binding protein YlxM (UPF0122 family)
MKMEKIVWQGMLYDFYGELLTEHQKKIYEEVVYENLSLGEIAEKHGISRQGVHDIIRRCDAALGGYEERLGLISRYEKIRSELAELKACINTYENDGDISKDTFCSNVRSLTDSIDSQL